MQVLDGKVADLLTEDGRLKSNHYKAIWAPQAGVGMAEYETIKLELSLIHI